MGKVIDIVIGGYSSDKTFFIISEKTEELRRFILSELHRGGSIVPVNGMWNRSEKEMIMTVVNRKEVTTLQRAIQHIDPHAFTRILNARRLWGKDLNGWIGTITSKYLSCTVEMPWSQAIVMP